MIKRLYILFMLTLTAHGASSLTSSLYLGGVQQDGYIGAVKVWSVGGGDVTNGMVAWWKMDEAAWNGTAGEVTDSAGTNAGASVSGAITTNGLVNRCGYFGNPDGYADMGAKLAFSGTNQFTLSAWVNGAAWQANNGGIMSRGDSHYVMWVTPTGGVQFWRNSASAWQYTDSASTIATGVWNHVAGVYNGATLQVYINGAASGAAVNSAAATIGGGSMTFKIGRYLSSAYDFTGRIDEARVYNRALTSNEVYQLWRLVNP